MLSTNTGAPLTYRSASAQSVQLGSSKGPTSAHVARHHPSDLKPLGFQSARDCQLVVEFRTRKLDGRACEGNLQRI